MTRLAILIAIGYVLAGPAGAQTAQPVPASQPTTTSAPASRPDQSPVVAPGSRIVWDIPYVDGGDNLQRLDIYAPRDAHAAPVMIFVHGGEWARHDKTEVSTKPKFFNEAGVVFVSVNYRLSGTAQHPAQADDVCTAVRWLRAHIAEYGGDPHKLVLMGHSAGCHIVTLVALDPRYLAKADLTPADLCGIVSWSGGAFDLVEKVHAGGMYADYIHKNFGDDEQAWQDASPMQYVANAKPAPRFLFASAEQGNPGSRTASEKIAALINAAGGRAQTIILAGKTHFTANHELGQRDDASGAALLDFMRAATAMR